MNALSHDEAVKVLELIADAYSCGDDCSENMRAIARTALGLPWESNGSFVDGAEEMFKKDLRAAGVSVP